MSRPPWPLRIRMAYFALAVALAWLRGKPPR